jgi:hypothetical protein
MMLNNFGRSGEQLVSCSVQLAKYSRRQQPDAQMASGKESRMLTAHSRGRVVYDNLQLRHPWEVYRRSGHGRCKRHRLAEKQKRERWENKGALTHDDRDEHG